MNHYLLVLTCLLSNDLCGMQKVSHSETLIPGGKSAITSYLHILPRDVEESIAQLLLRAYPALFSPASRVLSGHTEAIWSVVLVSDGAKALTGSSDNTVRRWDLKDFDRSPCVLSEHTGQIRSMALTPDGRWALTGSWDNTARLWDLVNFGSNSHVLSGHTNRIYSVALTPDGRWALTGSNDNMAQLWDLTDSGSSPRVLAGHTGAIWSVALTADGRWTLTGSNDKTARLWELIPCMPLTEVQKIIGTHEETTRGMEKT